MIAFGLVATASGRADAATSLDTGMSAKALPAPQVNGVVYDQAVIGNTVYAVGSFSSARPYGSAAGANETPRSNILAYNLTTGALLGFSPNVDGKINAVVASADGNYLVIGGNFTGKLAVLDANSGALVSGRSPSINSEVLALARYSSTIYVAGTFSAANSLNRQRVASFNLDTGAVTDFGKGLNFFAVPQSAASLGGSSATRVSAIAVSDDGSKIAIGGQFGSIKVGSAAPSSDPGYGLALLRASDSSLLPLPANSASANLIRNAGDKASISSLHSFGGYLYGTGFVNLADANGDGIDDNTSSTGTTEGTFKLDWSGNLVWLSDCHGDSYDVAVLGSAVYSASHSHFCGNLSGGGFSQRQEPTLDDNGQQTRDANNNLKFNQVYHHLTAVSTDPSGTLSESLYQLPVSPYHSFAGVSSPSLLNFAPSFKIGTYTGQNQAGWTVESASYGGKDYLLYGGEFTAVNGVPQQGLVRFGTKSASSDMSPSRPIGPSWTDTQPPWKPSVSSAFAGVVQVSLPAATDPDDSSLNYSLYRGACGSGSLLTQTTISTPYWTERTLTYTDTQASPGSTVSYCIRVSDPLGNSIDTAPSKSITVSSAPTLDTYSRAVLSDGASTAWALNGTTIDTAGDDTPTIGSGVTAKGPDSGPFTGTAASTFDGTTNALVQGNNWRTSPDEFSTEIWFRTTSTAGGKLVGFSGAKTLDSQTAGVNYDRHIYLDPSGKLNFGVYREKSDVLTSKRSFNDGLWHLATATLSPAGMRLYADGQLVASRDDAPNGIFYEGYWRVGGDTSWSGAAHFTGDLSSFALYPTALTADQVRNHWIASGRSPNGRVTAVFNTALSSQTVAFDASASTSLDGSISTYTWSFGDNSSSSSTSPQTSHTFAASGSYPVTLNVTDNLGNSASYTQTVTVQGSTPATVPTAVPTTVPTVVPTTVPTHSTIATDTFSRTAKKSWGRAPIGGAWTATGNNASGSVSKGMGHITLRKKGASMRVTSEASATTTIDASASFALNRKTSGTGTSAGILVRTAGTNAYAARLSWPAKGSLKLQLVRLRGTKTTVLTTRTIATSKVRPNQLYRVRVTATKANGATLLSAKAWKVGKAEPGWQLSATDGTAGLQGGGQVGVIASVASNAKRTTLPQRIDVDNFSATQ